MCVVPATEQVVVVAARRVDEVDSASPSPGRFRFTKHSDRSVSITETTGWNHVTSASTTRPPRPGLADRSAADGRTRPAGSALGAAVAVGAATRTTRGASATPSVRRNVVERALRTAERAQRSRTHREGRPRRLHAHGARRRPRISARPARQVVATMGRTTRRHVAPRWRMCDFWLERHVGRSRRCGFLMAADLVGPSVAKLHREAVGVGRGQRFWHPARAQP